jgi:ADP-heptose:LPS heptosyltransferase
MKGKSFQAANILVIDFGQLGDVVLSLPALRALRERFPGARITVAAGHTATEVINLSGYADATMMVDRVALRDGFAPVSVFQIFKFLKEVRRRKFDFVIDLHSLSETNLLGFFSGAKNRLYSRRPGRSLDFLSNFQPRPPLEDPKLNRHLIDRYLDVVSPLGVSHADRQPRLRTRSADDRAVDQILHKAKADSGSPLVGLFPGAGHPSRRWPLQRFAELTDFLVRNDQLRVLVFAGPEEADLISQMRRSFPASAVILERLTISQLASALARLAVFISNDTGPMHIAAAVGTPVVLLLDKRAPETYLPIGDRHQKVYNKLISEIGVEEVYEAARSALTEGRTATLFAS